MGVSFPERPRPVDERTRLRGRLPTLPGVLLAYLDESYDADRYWMAALVCPEHTVAPLTAALDEVVAQAARSYPGVSPTAELHGHDLVHAKGAWAPLEPMLRARIGVYNAAFRAIAAHQVEIIIRGVDRRRLSERYAGARQPHPVVLQHVLERVDECSERRHAHEPVLVIADQVGHADEYRQGLWRSQRHPTSGYRSRQLVRIVDSLHFVPSRVNRLVQAADLVVYLHARMAAGRSTDTRAVKANQALWRRIEKQVIHRHCWRP